ncbi:uncharacterized protein LOC120554388 [Perca fluviatilis]|uniref:uncharacterized protein LOC120554388 n=1 Tax=Perca fluviatilis TaxID=8168 RepID=UPI0019640AA3|nr:uncharacterized protein LOC120554388 [Perca fluviatilis]
MESGPPPSKLSPESGAGKTGGPSASTCRNSMHRKRALSRILAESAASNEGIDAPSTVDFEETEGFSLQDPGPLVLHRGSQCNIRCLQCSSGPVPILHLGDSRRDYMAAFSTSPNRSNDLDNGQQLHSSWGREGQRDHGGQFWPSGQGSMVWLGGGLRWHGLLPFFNRSLRGRAAPDILLIHCGGNNLGCRKSIDLIAAMKQDLQHLNQRFPQMIIVLSDITQRRRWRSGHPGKIDKSQVTQSYLGKQRLKSNC